MMSRAALPALHHETRDARPSPAGARAVDPNVRIREAALAHHTFVWRCLRRLGVPAATADDAAQHVFLAFSQRVADVPLEKERPFLFGVAVRVAANVRKVAGRSRERLADETLPDAPTDAPGPHDVLEQKERLAALDVLLEALPIELRTVFILAELERMTAQEIASYVEVPVGTVTSRLRRARELVERNIPRVRARYGGKP